MLFQSILAKIYFYRKTDMESCVPSSRGGLLVIPLDSPVLAEKEIDGTQRYCPLKTDAAKSRHSSPSFAVRSTHVEVH